MQTGEVTTGALLSGSSNTVIDAPRAASQICSPDLFNYRLPCGPRRRWDLYFRRVCAPNRVPAPPALVPGDGLSTPNSWFVATPLCAAAVFIAADTYYFRGSFAEIVITLYNFIKYNLSIGNLADHGLHPNWSRVGVDPPMLVGPLFMWFIRCNLYECMRPSERRVQKVHFETGALKQGVPS